MTTPRLRQTPLFDIHQKAGARLIEFGGWLMPLHYAGIVVEHLAVRQAAGLFDISHMGEVLVRGRAAAAFLNHVLTNDIRKLSPGRGQYTLLCNEGGGVIDDLYAYQLAEEMFLLVVNAARTEADVAWLERWAAVFAGRDALVVEDASSRYAAIAVQGPRARELVAQCVPDLAFAGTAAECVTALQKNRLALLAGPTGELLVACTGYTGEDGFEILGTADAIRRLWVRLLELGSAHGLQPCGLGARDTLRTEMGYPLYGHELDERTSPIEAGLGAFVAADKGDFVGRPVLAAHKLGAATKRCIAFRMAEKAPPPRPGYVILADGKPVGNVTSGTSSPSLGVGIGLGYVAGVCAQPGTRLEIEVRGRTFPAQVVSKPIYRRPQATGQRSIAAW